ncbi:MAG TPA: hypothetical protein VFS67_21765 [Polyangiaceae bacterium]|nr:hypothetical protein [Polyangiaceae bacterium]
MKIPGIGKIVTWLVEAIVGKAARDLTEETDPVPLTRRSADIEWHQRHAGPKVSDLLERQSRHEIPPPKGRQN